jgi:hypothetical protein
MAFLSSFRPFLINMAEIGSCPVAFPFFNLPLTSSVSTSFGQFVCTWSTLLQSHCSILQFKVLLIILRPPLYDFLFVAYYVTFITSNQ